MKIYQLIYDYNRSNDSEKDAYHIPFEHSNIASSIFLNKKHTERLPKKIYFRSNLNIITKTDFPLNDLRIPIMSDRLIKLIKSIGDINLKEIPAIMLDDKFLESKFDSSGSLINEVKYVDNYKAIMLLDRIDCFDYENSIYEPGELNPNIPGYIRKLVLNISDINLPPIFRIKESPSRILITEKVKKLIIDKDISGCLFENVETKKELKNTRQIGGILGKEYFELGRGNRKVSENYLRPYILGFNINNKQKPFVVAMGDNHSDTVATKLSIAELVSGKWDEHIRLSNSEKFVESLKKALKNKEEFPQKFILELIK
ncbi:hypothetical protein [Spongiivirga citrea]|uniref:Uncharacterized protein n=1 Tax=Spongiivirga citrea TaxID=1481457 RepID=A0A6M0CKM9_9FLAO|nr:hypothetical protein [Spongiivirga citrea]NER17553.1 hypothetical protein [Spongiivirga citrea]